MRQLPAVHKPTALSGAQVSPQPPQWAMAVVRFVSHASDACVLQSPNSGLPQVMTQTSSSSSHVAKSVGLVGGCSQSSSLVQASPLSQRRQSPVPPQSMSDSVPFFTLSLQLGARHVPDLHTPLSQSLGLAQLSPASQGPQPVVGVPPPQSVSVSSPFLTLSVQLGS